MKKNKIWRIKGFEGTFSDEELIELIWSGELKPDYQITTREMKKWVKLKDSIYQYYMEGREDEAV
ncbi:MAG: hypothetical protein IJ136_00445 [Erysipelotrichaceae bacterium]|jgi:hypothetical protein|nr:hypothetical protein [Erysipelotrichaceae bacterium]MBP1529280.1 hypothetical protein [Erysipelotrichaceae bacterium]MBQ1287473.1 hypothetical protein [Erysipelotrichaceae bacterium]MBQ1323568.1 hypothetical protein [Erysipelotrichaceae bacterium]MBQ1346961.1 hypothetical protein [Erysipelotrichaceae bacterium]